MDDRAFEVLLARAFGGCADALAVVDLDPAAPGRLLRVNDAMASLTGHGPEVLSGMSLPDLAEDEDGDGWRRLVVRWAGGDGGADHSARRCRRADGATLWVEVTGVPVVDGHATHAVVRLRDVTGRRPVGAVPEAAWRDPLTGVLNREGLHRRLRVRKEDASSGGVGGVLLFCDVDGLKDVNDRFGHLAGDAVIRATAGRLTACVRAGDVVARFGGDEFVVLAWGVSGPAVDQLVRWVGAVLAEAVSYDGNLLPVTASVGAAALDPDSTTIEEALRRADAAMYAAKQRRRA